jgi:predicted RND superfamily exporter protein
MDRFLRSLIRRSSLVLAIVAAITLLALTRIVDFRTGELRLGLDPSIDSMLPRVDPARDYYDDVRELFGGDEAVLVVLSVADVFTSENLGRIVRMGNRFEKLDGVHHVTSLANSLNIRSVDGSLEIDAFIEGVPDDPAEIARIRREALGSPVYAGNLITRDARNTSLLIHLFELSANELVAVDTEIRRIVEQERGDATVWITGGVHIKSEMQHLMLGDLIGTLPLAVVAMVAVGFLCFRTPRGILIPLSTVGIAQVWTLAMIAETTGAINFVTIAVPPIILAVGFAYTVHVVSAYYDALRGRIEPEDDDGVVFAATRIVALPVLLTGATTVAGFASLTISPLSAVQEFGLFCSIGIAASTILSLSFAPTVLHVLPMPRVRAAQASTSLDRTLRRLAEFDVQHRAAILTSGAVLAVVALVGMSQIEVGTNFVRNFPDDNQTRMDFDTVNEKLEGSSGFYVVVHSNEDDAFMKPANLRQVQRIQRWLEDQPEVGGTTAFPDYLEVINRAFHDDDPNYLTIPDSYDTIAQLLLFANDPEFESFVDSRYRTANIVVRSREFDSGVVAALADRIETYLAELPGGLEYGVTGNSILVSRTLDDVALGQALSLGAAFAIIFVILVLLFTSVRIGFAALIPNALPVLVYFGVLGFAGITLNTTTGLVACLVLGIAVDDTIHFLVHFNTASKRLASETRGVVESLISVGRPVTYTTAGLCAGFLALTASELKNQVEFGVLASLTLAVAWLVDVTFTPALATRLRVVTLWDVLTLDLGDDPRRSIPLFAGLRKTQARVVALIGSLQTYSKGHRLIQVGDPGDEMYVVIDGELRVSLPTEGGEIQFGTCKRGDIIGEIALFHGIRTADVEAATDVRLLRLDNSNLDRIRRRYPRTAATLFHNLSRTLADRAASTTEKVR